MALHPKAIFPTLIRRQARRDAGATRANCLRFAVLACAVVTGLAGWAADTLGAQGFQQIAAFKGPGFLNRALVAPGPSKGKENLYLAYANSASSLHLVELDADTGQHKVYPSPVASESGAWGLASGADGAVYIGTYPGARLLRFDPANGSFADLGKPIPSAQFIWQLVLGSDGKLYGGTFPQARLFSFDTTTRRIEDFGRMDPSQNYARSVAASADGFIYVGLGSEKAKLVAFEIATKKYRGILPEQFQSPGFAMVHRGDDGQMYLRASGKAFQVKGWNVTEISNQAMKEEANARLQDGRTIIVAGGRARVQNPKDNSSKELSFAYQGAEQDVARLAFGPDGMLYASTKMPLHLLRIQPATGQIADLGELGTGEVYSFLSTKSHLAIAAYAGRTPLMLYDPSKALAPGTTPASNPVLVSFKTQNTAWRPTAMVSGPGTVLYVGSRGGYGEVGGSLAAWDLATQAVETFRDAVPGQSVASLAEWRGLIIGSSSVRGGEGTQPAKEDAKLFIWDPAKKETIFSTAVMPKAGTITNLVITADSRVFGIADYKTFFIFDPAARRVAHTAPLPFAMPPRFNDNNSGLGADGDIWGTTAEGVFRVSISKRVAELVAKSPVPITGGFAMRQSTIYFSSGAKIYRYDMR